jgi:hypothetical protein
MTPKSRPRAHRLVLAVSFGPALVVLLGAVPSPSPASATHEEVEAARSRSLAKAAGAQAVSGALRARAEQHLAEREYWASRNANGLQAPNRAHRLRTYFGPAEIAVHDRTAAAAAPLVTLRLARVGRGASLAPVGAGAVVSERARVEIRRPGMVEWYENSPAGLEQGVTLAARPPGAGPLGIEFAHAGARASLRGEAIVFATAAGRRLRYDRLVARDARGRVLAARMELGAQATIRLVVEDAEAAYPLVVDPLLAAEPTADAQLESDQAGANLGFSVASAGDVNGDGAADVLVGAPFYDAGETDEGAAFVFLGDSGAIEGGAPGTASAQLESDQVGARFGFSVATAGDVDDDGFADVIVGAPYYDAGEGNEGAAFVFLGRARGIADATPATAAAQLESNQAYAQLGSSVASAGDVNGDGFADVLVGAPNYDSGETEEGAAFVFLGGGSGIENGSPSNAATQLESNQVFAYLGSSVASAGDVDGDGFADVLVGAPGYDAGETDEGVAFVFLGEESGIDDGTPITAAAWLESNQEPALLGSSVASAGDVNGDGFADVLVGAPSYDGGEAGEGAAFVFLGGASGITDGTPTTAAAQLESNQAGARLGASVASAGDVNGDGFGDVLVGAPSYDGGEAGEGAAFVFLGGASGITDGTPATAAAQLESNQAGARLGASVASAGDVNGDGSSDVLVGAPFSDAGETDEGAAFVFVAEPARAPASLAACAALGALRRRKDRCGPRHRASGTAIDRPDSPPARSAPVG